MKHGLFRCLGRGMGLLGAAAGCHLSTAEAGSKPPPPPKEALAWMDEITDRGPGPHRDLPPVKVSYGLSWNNVFDAGAFEVALTRSEQEPERWLVGVAQGRSSGLARALWPYDVAAQSVVDRETLRPRRFEISESERGKTFRYVLEFAPSRVSTRTTVIPGTAKGRGPEPAPAVSEKTYRYDSLHDVLSAVLYIRSLELADGDVVKSVISPFNKPYYAEFEVLGREKRKVKGEGFDAIRMSIQIRKINHDRTLQAYEKMRKATIWLSDDAYRLPIEVQAEIFVGFISARLTGREWLDPSAARSGGTGAASGDRLAAVPH